MNLLIGRPAVVLNAPVGPILRLASDSPLPPAAQGGQAEPDLIRSTVNSDVFTATIQEGRYSDAGAIGYGYAISADGGTATSGRLVSTCTGFVGHAAGLSTLLEIYDAN